MADPRTARDYYPAAPAGAVDFTPENAKMLFDLAFSVGPNVLNQLNRIGGHDVPLWETGMGYQDVFSTAGYGDTAAMLLGLLGDFAEPGPGELFDVARAVAPALALLPGIPIGLQRLIGSKMPVEMLDDLGTPMVGYHALGGAGDDFVGDIRVSGAEGHGHWGVFNSPMVQNSFDYAGRYDPNYAGTTEDVLNRKVKEMAITPEADKVLASGRFPGNAGRGLRPGLPPLNASQIETAEEILADLYDASRYVDEQLIARMGDRYNSPLAAYVADKTSEFVEGVMGGNPMDPEEFLLMAQELKNQLDNVLLSHASSLPAGASEEVYTILGRESFFSDPNTYVPPSPTSWEGAESYTPVAEFTDYARRLGYEAGVGPLANPADLPLNMHPDARYAPTEYASYDPEVIIYPLTPENAVERARAMGFSEEEIQAALNTPIPDRSMYIGNVRMDFERDVQAIIDDIGHDADLFGRPEHIRNDVDYYLRNFFNDADGADATYLESYKPYNDYVERVATEAFRRMKSVGSGGR